MNVTPATPPPLISLQGVSKSYPLLKTGQQQLGHLWARLKGQNAREQFTALQNISFEVLAGQSMGLIGVNGAGKSTLLKLIAGVIQPTTGQIERNGSVGALLELGAGFHPEYTGRENIYLSSALMGMSREQTEKKLDWILNFADIGEHIDQPVKHYSSGMVVRLGFAVTTSVRPDILITDEVLAVGDESFQKKCIQWMEQYLGDGGTLLLCAHSMYHIQKLCTKALWLDQGQIRMLGRALDVTREYLAWHEQKSRPAESKASNVASGQQGLYEIQSMSLNGQDGPLRIGMGEGLTVTGLVKSPDGRRPQVAVGIVRADGTPIYGVVSEMDGYGLSADEKGLFAYKIVFKDLPLLPGRYQARSHAMDPEGLRLFDQVEMSFDVVGDSREMGFVRLSHEWV